MYKYKRVSYKYTSGQYVGDEHVFVIDTFFKNNVFGH